MEFLFDLTSAIAAPSMIPRSVMHARRVAIPCACRARVCTSREAGKEANFAVSASPAESVTEMGS
jgi:hypothetical protein